MLSSREVIDRLVTATNAHDLDALVGCFSEDYVNETPVHPARGFRGNAQVRSNWQQIFAFVPDIEARVLRSSGSGGEIWSEWQMLGTRRDGSAHQMAGVVIFAIADGLIRHARFYLEPIDLGSSGVDDAVRDQVAPR